ncbi:MAG: CDP-alcohol phosphatidyltransferase family protein [Pseudomonadota bacterium]
MDALRQIPNLISVLRILMVAPFAWALITERFGLGLVLFAVAGVSDALDGFLAKTFGWQTRLGGFLDPLADKLLLVTGFVTLGWLELLPWWLVAMVILRDVVIVSGALVYHFHVGRFDARPTYISKVNTAMQITLVLAVVVDKGLYAVAPGILTALVFLVSVTTVLSGLDYVVAWARRARRGDVD